MNNPARARAKSDGRPRSKRTAAVLGAPINTGYVPIFLRNATGIPIKIGDVVAVDYATGTAFNGSATEAGGIILTWMVAVANIPAGAVGPFGALGIMYAKISLNSGASVAPGTWLEKDLTTGSLSLHSLGVSLASNNQPAPPNALAYLAEPATITTAGVYRVYFPGGPRSDWPSATWFEFFEDFLSTTDGLDTAGVGSLEQWAHAWARISDNTFPLSLSDPVGGIVDLTQDSLGGTPLLWAVDLGSFVPFVDPTDCMLEIRCAQKGTGAGTRRYGLWGATPSISMPSNGIILTHSNGGNMVVRVAVGGVEEALSTGLPMTDALFRTFRIQHDSVVGAFLVWVDGLYIGRIVSAVPSVPLGPGFHASANTASAYIDLIRVRSRR